MPLSRATQALIAKTRKAYGEESVVLGEQMRVGRRFTSGSLALDVALGGGFVSNQWVEILGKYSAAKTSTVLKAIAANMAQDPDFTCFWVAAEHYNADWAEKLGVDNSRMIIHSTQATEEAYTVLEDFTKNRATTWCVLDSYPALVPNGEAAKEFGESTVALGARLTGQFFRKIGPATRRSLTDPDSDSPFLGIFINQWRKDIGAWAPQGTPDTSPGGEAKDYAFYQRVDLRKAGQITEKRKQQLGEQLTVPVGQTIKFNILKNKAAPPRQVAAVDFYFNDAPTLGFHAGDYDVAQQAVTMGLTLHVIERSAKRFYTFRGTKWDGLDSMKQTIKESAELQDQIREDVMEAAARPMNEGALIEGEEQNED